MAAVGLKLFPRFFSYSYRSYSQYLGQREAARLERFRQEQNGAPHSVGYEAFAGAASEARLWAKAGK